MLKRPRVWGLRSSFHLPIIHILNNAGPRPRLSPSSGFPLASFGPSHLRSSTRPPARCCVRPSLPSTSTSPSATCVRHYRSCSHEKDEMKEECTDPPPSTIHQFNSTHSAPLSSHTYLPNQTTNAQTWNTIASVEDRTGAAVPGVLLVWCSVVNAVRQYHQTLPLAGKVRTGCIDERMGYGYSRASLLCRVVVSREGTR